MTQKASYAQVLESLVAEAAVQRFLAVGAPKSVAPGAGEPPVRIVHGAPGPDSGDGAAEEVDLVLLAHDHVLEQVLEGL